MKCECCDSGDSVQPFTLAVVNVGMIQMVLCVACRLQLGTVVFNQRTAA